MKAIVIHEFGGPEVLKLEEVPTPEPAAGEVLITVYASGVNPIDWKIRKGERKEKFPSTLP
jgi:NADPH:quinone reductase-like Zn-dependent oxidoreductase